MDVEQSLADLVNLKVIEPVDDTNNLQLTHEFYSELKLNRELVDKAEDNLRTKLEEVANRGDQVELFSDLAVESPNFIARLLTLASFTGDRSLDELVPVTVLLDRFFRPPPSDKDVPEAFFAIHGDQLGAISLYDRTIVYIWRHECDPCQAMKISFDDIFSEGVDDIGLFAVYGPNWIRLLREKYDVVAGPTTLFIINGRVDARLLGAHPQPVIKAEIEQIRKRSSLT